MFHRDLHFVLIISIATIAFAREVVFTKKYVDSNTWSYVTTAQKETTTSTADLKITALYKADGSTSDYWRIYAKATSSGTKTLVQRGTYYALQIPKSSQAALQFVQLFLMGHDPALDCQASGSWVVH